MGPVDLVTVPYEVAYGVKHRKSVSLWKVCTVKSVEAGGDAAGEDVSSEGVVVSPVHVSHSALTVKVDVPKGCALCKACKNCAG